MNKKNYVAVATLAFAMLTSCAGQKEAKSTSGIDLANMDTTVSAGTDFFRYACGGWNDAHRLRRKIIRLVLPHRKSVTCITWLWTA